MRLRDCDREEIIKHTGIVYHYVSNRKFDEDDQQDAMKKVCTNWIKNRSKCPQIKDVTFVGNTAEYFAKFRIRQRVSMKEHMRRKSVSLNDYSGNWDLPDPKSTAEEDDRFELLESYFRFLLPREKLIMECKAKAMTLDEIGATMNITKERVRQLYQRGVEKLRQRLRKDGHLND